jgi:hypothetical protein
VTSRRSDPCSGRQRRPRRPAQRPVGLAPTTAAAPCIIPLARVSPRGSRGEDRSCRRCFRGGRCRCVVVWIQTAAEG